jgi:hypothetical protein
MPEKSHGFHAVIHYMHLDERIDNPKGFLREPRVTRTVFNQENL